LGFSLWLSLHTHVADAYGISEADYVWGHQLSDRAKAFGETDF
jgi:hypothetical protein